MADVADALAELAREVETCTRCDLHRTATRGVPGEGPSNSRVLLIGEGPGFNEDKQGRPFVGAAGKLLDQVLLPAAGLQRSEVYITNVVKHRPPENRDPDPRELAACLPYLERQMELIKPRVVVTLGRFSLGTFFPGTKISVVHGQIREHEGRHFYPMYHPAAALHQERLRQTLIDDMKRLGELLAGPTLERSDPEDTPGQEQSEPPEQLSLF